MAKMLIAFFTGQRSNGMNKMTLGCIKSVEIQFETGKVHIWISFNNQKNKESGWRRAKQISGYLWEVRKKEG